MTIKEVFREEIEEAGNLKTNAESQKAKWKYLAEGQRA